MQELYNKNSTSFNQIIFIFGGLALFLYALDLLKENLKAIYSNKLYKIIQKGTNKKWKAFMMGILGTIIIQSSSGITAIVLSLMTAGYLQLPAALGIMIGANIGTCFSAFFISLEINNLSFYLIIFSFIFYIIIKKEKWKIIFSIFLNIGIVFLGLELMGIGFDELAKSNVFVSFIKIYNNSPLLSILFGSLLTAFIQSSSATIGVLEQMYQAGIITLKSSIAIMLGSNIGTTITGYFSTIHTNKEAKQAVNANVLFNLLGVLLFYILLNPYYILLKYLENSLYPNNLKISIAMSHLLFNVITSIIAYFLFDLLLKLVKYQNNIEKNPNHLLTNK